MSWTDERIETLKTMWAEGSSGGQIAARLGATRNAVIGKVHRLGLPQRQQPGGSYLRPKRKKTTDIKMRTRKAKTPKHVPMKRSPLTNLFFQAACTAKPEPLPLPSPADANRKLVSFVDLEPHQCRYIPREPSDGFCGQAKHDGLPYCTRHAMVAFRPDSNVRVYPGQKASIRRDLQNVTAAEEFLE